MCGPCAYHCTEAKVQDFRRGDDVIEEDFVLLAHSHISRIDIPILRRNRFTERCALNTCIFEDNTHSL